MDGILTGTTAEAAAEAWLGRFQAAMDARDEAAIAALFATESHWRDILAFTWNLRTEEGRDAICEMLDAQLGTVAPSGFRLQGEASEAGGVTAATALQAILRHADCLGEPVALTVNFCAALADGDFEVEAISVAREKGRKAG